MTTCLHSKPCLPFSFIMEELKSHAARLPRTQRFSAIHEEVANYDVDALVAAIEAMELSAESSLHKYIILVMIQPLAILATREVCEVCQNDAAFR